MFTIKNDTLTVQISTKGGELRSIVDVTGREWLWQGNPAVWAGQAPLLFPFIGRLQDGSYTFDGTTYPMTKHGFARDLDFTVTNHGTDTITLSLSHSPYTLELYPFPFTLAVTYTLEGFTLRKTHQVTNLGNVPMYYELGGHDAYNLCFSPEESMDDCHFFLPDVTEIHPYEINGAGMLTPNKKTIPLPRHQLGLKPMDFNLDTFVMDDLPAKSIALQDGSGVTRITMDFHDFPILALWTMDYPQDTNYVCIEPWTSLPDCTFVGRNITEKQGVRQLAPQASDTLSFHTKFHL